MKRPWKLTIEVGGDSPRAIGSTTPPSLPPAAPQSELDTSPIWEMLVDGRRKMLDAIDNGADDKVNSIVSWIGGALAVLSKITKEDPARLHDRLVAEVPNLNAKSHEGVEFKKVERTRPKPHPGSQRVLDLSELSPEEREQLGITPPNGMMFDK